MTGKSKITPATSPLFYLTIE